MRSRFFLFIALALAAGAAVVGYGMLKSSHGVSQGDKQIVAAQPWSGALKTAPSIHWSAPIKPNERGRLQLAFKAEASAPLSNLQVKISPASGTKAMESDLRDIPVWLAGNRSIDWDGEVDLTGSLLAGQPVSVQIVATDEDHRTGTSDAVNITLPEHHFTQPLASALYNLRKSLREDPAGKRGDALKGLASLLQQRGAFEDQPLTLLTLRSAAVRIALDNSQDGIQSALDLLWHAALLMEENPTNVTVSVRLVPPPAGTPAAPKAE